jgi:hypothetical protein
MNSLGYSFSEFDLRPTESILAEENGKHLKRCAAQCKRDPEELCSGAAPISEKARIVISF